MAVEPDTAFWLRCPYDVAALPASVAEAAEHSHPVLVGPEEYRGSTVYEGLQHVQALFERLAAGPSGADHGRDLLRRRRPALLRRLVDRAAAGHHALGAAARPSFELAVHEIATNSVRHGGGSGRFRVWTEPDAVRCEVADAGHIADPLVGRVAPDLTAEGGRGRLVGEHAGGSGADPVDPRRHHRADHRLAVVGSGQHRRSGGQLLRRSALARRNCMTPSSSLPKRSVTRSIV